MKISNPENPDVPITPQDFLKSGEYDQGDVALISYDSLYDFVSSTQSEMREEFLRMIRDIEDGDANYALDSLKEAVLANHHKEV